MRRMRVAVITTSYCASLDDPAGHFVRAEVRDLERAGHEVRVVAPEASGAFGWPGVAARIQARPWRVFDAARWVIEARLAVGRERQLDRIISHWALPCAWPIADGARAPVEVVSHGGDVRLLLGMPHALRAWIVRRIASRADAWRFVSAELLASLDAGLDARDAEAVHRVARIEACRIEMPDVREAIERRKRELHGVQLFVSAGRLIESKCVHFAIDYVADCEKPARLVVVGDGPERVPLEAYARARGVDARFVGKVPRPEALAWIGAADALLHASRAEGLSTVVREAELLGTHVKRMG